MEALPLRSHTIHKSTPPPLNPADRIFYLLCTLVATIIAHKSLPSGWKRNTISFTILTGGTLYSLGATCKCMKETVTHFFDGFGCTTGGGGCSPRSDRWTILHFPTTWGGWGDDGRSVHHHHDDRVGRGSDRHVQNQDEDFQGGGGGSFVPQTPTHHGTDDQRPKRFEEKDD